MALPVLVPSKNEQSIEQLLPCWKNISTCASSMPCQSFQLMWCSCRNPVHIDHQCWRKGKHAGVSQWPLWRNHSFPSFHPRQRSEQWRVSPPQCWELRKREFGRRIRPCFGKMLLADAAVWRLPGISYLSRITLPAPVQGKTEQSIEQQLVPCWKNKTLC